jgi:Fe-S cluster assembly protein SufB
MTEPEWANVLCKTRLSSDFYYSAPKAVDPNKIRRCRSRAFRNVQKLGISVDEQKMMNNVAMDIVVDSVSVATTFKKSLVKRNYLYEYF